MVAGLGLPAMGFESYDKVSPAVQKQMDETRAQIVKWLISVDKDAFRPGKVTSKDTVDLKDGSTFTGKVLDYGPYLGLVGSTDRKVISRALARKFTLSWGDQAPKKPNLPDLDVTYIERLPRYRSNHGNLTWDTKGSRLFLTKPNPDPVWPKGGTKATFKAHIVNKGPVASKPFKYEFLIDGKTIGGGQHDGLKPGDEVVLDQAWVWKDGEHTITCKVVPEGQDFSVWNNSHSDRVDSLGLIFVIAQSTRDGFDGVMNMAETFSCEDWVQYHFQVMNFLFADSIFPGSPKGCLERVRVDEIVFLPDNVYPDKEATTGNDKDGRALHEGKWGLSPWSDYANLAQGMNWGLLHELGHQLGIIDGYFMDHNRGRITARDKTGALIDVGYSVPYEGMMRGHGPHVFEEPTAIALNWMRGKHRGGFGSYLFNLPKQCGVRILDYNGTPISNAEIRIFRRFFDDSTGEWLFTIPNKVVFEGKTDADGVFMLPNEDPPATFTTDEGFTRGPSPFGDALVLSNTGVLLFEIWNKDRRDIQFTDVTDFVVGMGRGHKDKYIRDIVTALPGVDDRVKPATITAYETDGYCDRVKLRWGAGEGGNRPVKYRLYSVVDGLPITRMYMSEIATVNAEGPFAMSICHPPTWTVATAIDQYGNESAPSIPTFSVSRMFTRVDVDSKNQAVVTGWVTAAVDTGGVAHPLPMRTAKPFGGAVALTVGPGDELIELSQEPASISIIGKDGMETASFGGKGSGDGELNKPVDIDRDQAGSIYVADTGNNRIAIFGPDGKFIASAGAGNLEKPVAVEADKSGNIYVIQDKKPGVVKLAKQGDSYADPLLFLATKEQPLDVTSDSEGRIFVSENTEPGITALAPDGQTLGSCAKWQGQSLAGIVGMAPDRSGNLACATGIRGPLLRVPISALSKIGEK